MNNPLKKERKKRIKAQNAERKTERQEIEPLTPEQIEAVKLMARGLFAMIVASLPKGDEFPSELDVN
jgi:hypothetical protein